MLGQILLRTRGGLALAGMAALALAGCTAELGPAAGFNTPETVGELPANYQAVSAEWVRASLKDPAKPVTVQPPLPAEVASCNIGVLGKHYGWRVPVRYAVDDGCGDCNGEKTVYLWFNRGRIDRTSYFPDQC